MTKKNRLNYRLIRSRRRTLSLVIHPDQTIEVRSPLHLSQARIDRFLDEKAGWIEKKLEENHRAELISRQSEQQQQQAALLLREEIEEALACFQGPRPRRLLLRDLTSRWGSCSSRQTISLNLRLAQLPARERRYVIFHELCHLREMNHSRRFWQLLESYVPDARNIRQAINRQYRLTTDREEYDDITS
ncbi:MAG: DUF45 domain-containing protein [Eubacteriales bacterium]|nr:DUF45 domain-containing protein [Eubacteriales bacterium]